MSFINPRFLLGFSVFQIEQVLKNYDKLFTITDILSLVEIWDVKHAQMIQHILHKIFNDISVVEETSDSDDSEEELNEWNDAIPDVNYWNSCLNVSV